MAQILFSSIVMYDNEFKTKENKITKDKNSEHNLYIISNDNFKMCEQSQ